MSQFLPKEPEQVTFESAEKIFTADLTVDRTILDLGENARVHGISISNSSGSAAEVTFVDSINKLKFLETVGNRSTVVLNVPFETSGGLVAQSLSGAQANKIFISTFYSIMLL